MILAAEAEGRLKAGDTIVEPTSGNTGIGLAMLAAARGYRLILVMPDTMSVERRNLLQAYGAEYVLTPGAKGMQGALDEVERILQENPHYFVPQQFANPANPEIHRTTTAREILEQTEGQLDAFVAGVGTGGTVTGVGEVLKQQLPAVKIIAVEPAASAVLSGKKAGPHKIQGIGAGFVPSVFNKDIVDEVFPVNDQDAMETARQQQKKACWSVFPWPRFAALQLAASWDWANVTAIAPDTGERYLTTELFKHD